MYFLSYNELNEQLRKAEAALSQIASDKWQASLEADNPDFCLIQRIAIDYLRKKNEQIR